MASDLFPGGWQSWPRRETVVNRLREAQDNGEDPASALIEIFREGPELLSRYRTLRSNLQDAYRRRRQLQTAQSNAADQMRQAKDSVNPSRANEKWERAEERWDELEEELGALAERIEELETELERTARTYDAEYFEVADAAAVSLPAPDQIEAKVTR